MLTCDLRCGDWREVLADVECDAILQDPPFSDRVHGGQRTGSSTRKTTIHYDPLTEADAHAFAASWAPRCRHWALTCCDHLAARWWEAAWTAAGWYVFAPVAIIRMCPTPRMAGDGPTSALDYIIVARPKHRLPDERIGSRPGFYLQPGQGPTLGWTHPGAKQVDTMRAILRDYTLPGDVVVDAFAGSGSTLVAARLEGRNSIGAELSADTYAKASARIALPWTPSLWHAEPAAVQAGLFDAR